MKEALTFDDVLIVPKFSKVRSRKDVSLTVSTNKMVQRGLFADLPVVSSNMDTVTGPEMAKAMLSYGAQACLHRFCSIEENLKMFEESEVAVRDGIYRPMVSIGLGYRELERAQALFDKGATSFIIDVANGAMASVVEQANELRYILGNNGSIIVGNFATGHSTDEFFRESVKVDGFKVGIGPSGVCTTRIKTGAGYPQFSAILDVCQHLKKTGMTVIADGGMRTPGDIAKALGAGADFCMLGGMLAGTDEAPGEVVWKSIIGEYLTEDVVYPKKLLPDGTRILDKSWPIHLPAFKNYRGSASKESYEVQEKVGSHRTSEGESIFIPCKGPVKNILQDIEGGLRSSLSYVGAFNIHEFHEKVEFVRVTSAGYIEGTSYGAKK